MFSSKSLRVSLLFSLAPSLAITDVPNVNTTSGVFKGFSPYPIVNAYLGIPFARPPVGKLRFAPPKAFVPKDNAVQDATLIKPGCYQVLHTSAWADKGNGISESEDCLSINVWKPAEQGKELLPVLIWLYPGGFGQGSNGVDGNSGVPSVRDQNDIIFVSPNYRLNIFGFPNSDGIKKKNPGLLDQRLAIEWIRDNIASFGGDPTRMTLMGHSAGSMSISYYSYQYVEDPIVSGFVALSGQPALIPSDSGSSWSAVTNGTGCDNSDADKELACMQEVAPRALKSSISASNLVPLDWPLSGGTPVIDNVTMFPLSEYATRGKAGKFAKIPLLVSNSEHEGDGILPFNPVTGVDVALSDQTTAFGFQCPVSAVAGYWVAQDVPVWRMLHSGDFPELQPYSWMRSYHGSEVAIFFQNELKYAYQEVGQAVCEAGAYLRKAVAAFVRDPEKGLLSLGWPKYTGESKTLVRLFENNTATASFEDPKLYDAICAQAA